jgi:hypothetical protein
MTDEEVGHIYDNHDALLSPLQTLLLVVAMHPCLHKVLDDRTYPTFYSQLKEKHYVLIQ